MKNCNSNYMLNALTSHTDRWFDRPHQLPRLPYMLLLLTCILLATYMIVRQMRKASHHA